MKATNLAAVSEATFQRQVEDLLTIHGWATFHDLTGKTSGNAAKGFPDIIAIRGPRLIALELKTQNGRVTAEQTEWIARFDRVETTDAHIVRPADFDVLEARLRRPPEQLTITSNSTDATWTEPSR